MSSSSETPSATSTSFTTELTNEFPSECNWCGRMVKVLKRHPWMSTGCATVVVGFIVLIAVLDVTSKIIIGCSVLGVVGCGVYYNRNKTAQPPAQQAVHSVKSHIEISGGSASSHAQASKPQTPEGWLQSNGFTKKASSEHWELRVLLTKVYDESEYNRVWNSLQVPATIYAVGSAAKHVKQDGDNKNSQDHGFLVITVKINKD